MLHKPYYDPEKSYEDNFNKGPFGAFVNKKKYKDGGEPKYEFLGQKVYLPFGIPSGPLINGNFVKGALDKGFDLVEYKDTRTRKYPCHPLPNIIPLNIKGNLTIKKAEKGVVEAKKYKSPISITNSFGIPSMDPSFWQNDLAKTIKYAKKGQVVIGGLQGTLPEKGGFDAYLKDFILIAKLVKETKVKIIELNLSCPNEGADHLLCFDVERSKKVVESVRKVIGDIPLIIKIAYFPDKEHFEKFVKAICPIVDAVAAINTITTKIFNDKGEPALTAGRLTSGTCGEPIRWAGLEMTKRLKSLRKKLNMKYKIIGVGGVLKPKDYFTYIESGADAVMSATGSMWNPYLAQEIKKHLK